MTESLDAALGRRNVHPDYASALAALRLILLGSGVTPEQVNGMIFTREAAELDPHDYYIVFTLRGIERRWLVEVV